MGGNELHREEEFPVGRKGEDLPVGQQQFLPDDVLLKFEDMGMEVSFDDNPLFLGVDGPLKFGDEDALFPQVVLVAA